MQQRLVRNSADVCTQYYEMRSFLPQYALACVICCGDVIMAASLLLLVKQWNEALFSAGRTTYA
jgi:hypothetical protein